MEELLQDLNEAQREAVVHEGGPLLVVAGAGSGKTRVITRRVAWRIQQGLHPSQVLAITFTNKAAGEMRERVGDLIGPSRAWISTFHSLGARFLRMEGDAIGLDRNFTIFDAADQLSLIREILKELGLKGKEHRPRDYAWAISRRKNLLGDEDESHEDDGLEARVFEVYETSLEQSRALDFDDLLFRTVSLLRTDEEVRARFSSRFRTVLVDEYQDTNRLQFELTRLLARDHNDVCATGDPDQSIYRWRGAEVRNILEFEKDFPGTTMVKLEENYRSTNRILQAAGAVISNNRHRVDRDLRSSLGDGEKIRVRAAYTEADEARAVVDGVEQALLDGYTLDEVAVFYRTNACSRTLEQAFRLRNLPYVIVGSVEFYERREIKDLIAYLRVLVNPLDVLDLNRIINVPPRGIGTKTVAGLRAFSEETGLTIRETIDQAGAIPGLRKQAKRSLAGFSELIRELSALPRSPTRPVLEYLLEKTQYRLYLEDHDDRLVHDRLENVEELLNALSEYDEQNPDGSLEDFLAETALIRSRAAEVDRVSRVTLMTLHSAKGLEFPVVFVTALEEGILPHARCMESDEALEEERRLVYVGMTRAQRRLSLSFARSRAGGGMPGFGSSIPSRFLMEIPEELVEGEMPGRRDLEILEDTSYYEPEYCDDAPPFDSGDRVVHEQFGTGRVVRLSGFGPTAKVTVDFFEYGEKKLILEYARLRKAREEYR